MKVVNREIFLKLTPGTIYSKYRSLGMIEGLYQKYDTWTNDWIYQDLLACVEASDDQEFSDVMLAAEDGAEFTIDLECGERDGSFEEDEMFVIYSKKDLGKLVIRLNRALEEYPGTS